MILNLMTPHASTALVSNVPEASVPAQTKLWMMWNDNCIEGNVMRCLLDGIEAGAPMRFDVLLRASNLQGLPPQLAGPKISDPGGMGEVLLTLRGAAGFSEFLAPDVDTLGGMGRGSSQNIRGRRGRDHACLHHQSCGRQRAAQSPRMNRNLRIFQRPGHP
jgi:hypothetical protein